MDNEFSEDIWQRISHDELILNKDGIVNNFSSPWEPELSVLFIMTALLCGRDIVYDSA